MSVPYQRLPRIDARWRWWRPLVALAFLAGWYLVSQVLITVAYFIPVAAVGGASGLTGLLDDLQSGALDPTDPLTLSLTLVSLVVLLPGVLLAVKIARIGPAGILSSTRFRVRWAWTAWCLLPTLVIAAVMFVVQTGLFGDGGMITTDGGFAWNHDAIGQSTVSLGTLTLTIALVVLLVPFQGAAEEYIFRGFLMQTVASWIPRRVGTVIAVAVSTVVFAVLHIPNGYNVWGMVEFLAWWRGLDRRFAGHEAPRFRGVTPAWAGGVRWIRPGGTGWATTPARADDVAGSDHRADSGTDGAVDSAVGVAGRP